MTVEPAAAGWQAPGESPLSGALAEIELLLASPSPTVATAVPPGDAKPLKGTIITRHWWIVALLTIIAAAGTIGTTILRWNTTWDASTLVRVGPPGVFGDQFTDPAYVDRVIRSVAALSGQATVQEASWKKVGIEAGTNTLSVEAVRETELLAFHSLDSDGDRAQRTVTAYVEESRRAVRAIYGQNLKFMPANAEPEVVEVRPPLIVRGALGGFAGLLFGIAIASVLDRRR